MLDVNWVAPTSNGGAPIASWVVTANPGALTCWYTPVGTATYCPIKDITAGIAYTVTVAASNAVGTGPATSSAAVAATPAASNIDGKFVTGANGTTQVDMTSALPAAATSAVAVLTAGVTAAASPTAAGSTLLGGRFRAPGTWVVDASMSGLVQGRPYTITVFARSGAGILSGPVAKTFNGTLIAAPGRPIGVVAGRPAHIVWRVTTQAKTGVSRERVSVFVRRKGSAAPWRAYATVVTDTRGYAVLTPVVIGDTDFQLRYAGSTRNIGSVAPVVVVQPTGAVRSVLSTPTVRRGGRATIVGTVLTRSLAQPVLLQQFAGGRWRTVASTTATSTKSYAFVLPTGSRGDAVYRVARAATTDLAAAVGTPLTLTIT
jgi:hypothetical protein